MKRVNEHPDGLTFRKIGWLTAAFLVLIAGVLLPTQRASGMDMGPKPTMDFEFTAEPGMPAIAITEAVLLECSDSSCSDAKPLEELGPQGITCQEMSCSSMAYGYAAYHRLVVTFSDGITRQSGVFQKNAFHAIYKVSVGQDDLRVKEGRGRMDPLLGALLGGLVGVAGLLIELGLLVALMVREGKGRATWEISKGFYWSAFGLGLVLTTAGGFFSLALPITALIEIALGIGYALWRKRPVFPLAIVILVMNVFTQFGLWGALETVQAGNSLVFTLILEGGIWLVETFILFFTQRKTLPFKEAALLSLVLNGISFLIGLILPL